ncbi:putative odorant receptor 71a [Copidosoma floridanum]|uniref:putative odorant receptor 71a n=1 Tax=Copidosoma floridanum TaxID=29053 RepID=UPI0006C95CC2|nr:putative odorant receptor 71a [Copidosoma floridanum]
MKILPIPLAILTICGFWRPASLEPNFIAKHAYNCFSCFAVFLIYTFTLSHLVGIVISAQDFEGLTGSCFMLLSMLNVCCKITNILYFHRGIAELTNILETGYCVARDSVERDIQLRNHNKARLVTLFYLALTETTCTLITVRTFFLTPHKILPFKAWIPYATEGSITRYWLTFLHQTIAHVGAANVQIANDTLICGLLIHASAQLEVLKHRYRVITEESARSADGDDRLKRLVDCIEHHRCIKLFSAKLNGTFNVIIFFQFVTSSLVLCSSVYLLSRMTLLSVHFMSLSLYLSCMLYQIFLFCWYGNEVILQSSDLVGAMYAMDWTVFGIDDKKNLLRMMILVRKPIKFTSSFLINLSIDSYCKILKTSYSVFNFLQRTSM